AQPAPPELPAAPQAQRKNVRGGAAVKMAVAASADSPLPAQANLLELPPTAPAQRKRRATKTAEPAPAAPPPKPRKRQPSEAAEPVDVARLLSIAPAEGPLSTALKSVGWRINPRLLGQLTRKGVRK